MSILDRIFDMLKREVEMRSDIDRLAGSMDALRTRGNEHDQQLFDHEKRLIRIEALIDLTRGGGFTRPSLPRE